VDLETIRQCRDDPEVFSRVLTGAPLWPWQAEVAKSPARYRCILAGRRAGKSRLLALLGTYTAFRRPGASVVVVSVGEVASLRVLADVASLCSSPLLAGSVADELKATVRLSNGSTVSSFPASMRQIRGISADLLILDEAAFIPRDIWTAAFPSVADRVRAGGKVIFASTPWPLADSWFRDFWQRGIDGDTGVASWHCPSSVNPQIGDAELADLRAGMSAEEYEREIEARWTSEQGSWFTAEEIEAAVADYELMPPERARQLSPWDREDSAPERQFSAAGGVDYGFAVDSNAVTIIGALNDIANERLVHYVSWIEAHRGMEYSPFVDRLVDISRAYDVRMWASEVNGVGSAPTQDLRRRLREEGISGYVIPVWTDARRKQAGFSKIKSLMQAGTLILPRDPALLRELHALDYERTDAGSMRIAARTGFHDDLSMSLLQAVSCLRPMPNPDVSAFGAPPGLEHTVTGRGTVMPVNPRPRLHHRMSFKSAEGRERSADSAW
jgi:hypothetical protein